MTEIEGCLFGEDVTIKYDVDYDEGVLIKSVLFKTSRGIKECPNIERFIYFEKASILDALYEALSNEKDIEETNQYLMAHR